MCRYGNDRKMKTALKLGTKFVRKKVMWGILQKPKEAWNMRIISKTAQTRLSFGVSYKLGDLWPPHV